MCVCVDMFCAFPPGRCPPGKVVGKKSIWGTLISPPGCMICLKYKVPFLGGETATEGSWMTRHTGVRDAFVW